MINWKKYQKARNGVDSDRFMIYGHVTDPVLLHVSDAEQQRRWASIRIPCGPSARIIRTIRCVMQSQQPHTERNESWIAWTCSFLSVHAPHVLSMWNVFVFPKIPAVFPVKFIFCLRGLIPLRPHCPWHSSAMSQKVFLGEMFRLLTGAPLGYFYNAPDWGWEAISSPPSDLRNYWADSKNSRGIWKPWKNCWRKTNFIDLGVTSDVTGQVKVKMFDISGLVTSVNEIAMLSTNKAN